MTFICEGRDARGRDLEWVVWPEPRMDFDPFTGLDLFGDPADASRPPDVLTGDRVSLTWVANAVREGYAIGIVMRTKDSPFHLGARDFSDADDIRYFLYAVNPPL